MPKIERWQAGQLVETIDPRTLDQARAEAIERVEAGYNAAIAAGVEISGVRWAATEGDLTQLTRGLVVLNTALITGAVNAATPAAAVFGREASDYHGNAVPLTVGQYAQMSLALAAAVGALQGQRNTINAQARAAESNEAADAIDWSNPS